MDLQKLDLTTLMDMLSEQTTTFTRMLTDRKNDGEFQEAKELIKLLQAEIEFRKTIADPVSSSGDNEFIREENTTR